MEINFFPLGYRCMGLKLDIFHVKHGSLINVQLVKEVLGGSKWFKGAPEALTRIFLKLKLIFPSVI